jgi:lysophospholipase L1-like esterase
MRVVAIPGAKAYDIFARLHTKQIRVENYSVIFLAIGTNNLTNMADPPTLIADSIMTIVYFIRLHNPHAMVAVCGMLIRPKDLGTFIEYRRRLVNTIVQKLCRAQGVIFLRAWKVLMTGSQVRSRVYARDGLHLNRTGANVLYRYLKGNLTNFEGLMRL